MRTIKFRAWDGKKITSPTMNDHFGNLNNAILNCLSQGQVIDQFTGLQDKNGADIYEGDILDGDGIVEWNDVEFCWSVKDKGYDGVDQWHSLQFKNCPIEITGNIHEGGINVL